MVSSACYMGNCWNCYIFVYYFDALLTGIMCVCEILSRCYNYSLNTGFINGYRHSYVKYDSVSDFSL